ncbi:hypothetical protein QF026_001518 [Streptomyces aurantiacus]|nr:hypothetical protein [Streptomyces aurantiacus]
MQLPVLGVDLPGTLQQRFRKNPITVPVGLGASSKTGLVPL